MNQLRSIGAFMVVAAILCFVIAYERYQTALVTAKEVASHIEGFEFEGIRPPKETYVAGFAGVALLVAGVRCFATWRAGKNQNQADDGLISNEE